MYNGGWKFYQYTWIEHILLYETYTKGSETSSFNLGVLLFTYSDTYNRRILEDILKFNNFVVFIYECT